LGPRLEPKTSLPGDPAIVRVAQALAQKINSRLIWLKFWAKKVFAGWPTKVPQLS